MIELPELRDGDEVAITFDGVARPFNGHMQVWFGSGVGPWRLDYLRQHATKVEVTLRADHPSHDLPGTVRAGQGKVWIKVAPGGAGDVGVWWDIVTGEERTGDKVEDYPIVHEALVPLVRAQQEII